MPDTKECQHDACHCAAQAGSDFCSDACREAQEAGNPVCPCGHSGCN